MKMVTVSFKPAVVVFHRILGRCLESDLVVVLFVAKGLEGRCEIENE